MEEDTQILMQELIKILKEQTENLDKLRQIHEDIDDNFERFKKWLEEFGLIRVETETFDPKDLPKHLKR